jgi:hypothetical protein
VPLNGIWAAGPLVGLLLSAAGARAPMLPRAQDPEAQVPLPLEVNHAIASGVEHLKREQRPDGTWPGPDDVHPCGMGALVAYTLVRSGVRPSDPSLARALSALQACELKSVYSNAVLLMLIESLPAREAWRDRAQKALEFLLAQQHNGVWAYPWGEPDMSNSQFALLGLRSAHRLGLTIPAEAVRDSAEELWRWQDRTGGFGYAKDRPPTGGMTAATLAGFAVLDELSAEVPSAASSLRKHGRERESAVRWLAEHFAPSRNAYGVRGWTPTFGLAYLWAVERFCGLTQRERLGERDWYGEGARFLLDRQNPGGEWGRTEETCFALLFLRRATVSPPSNIEELTAALEQNAKLRAEPLRASPEVPAIAEWLLAGPWQGKADNSILVEPPFDPAKVRARERGKLAQQSFERVRLPTEAWCDLEVVTKRPGDALLWALATNVELEPSPGGKTVEPLGVLLWLTVEDGCAVWWDGEEVYRSLREQAPIEEDQSVKVRVMPGRHALLVLVEDDRGVSAVRVRVSDAGGRKLAPDCGLSWAVSGGK